jgi:hypothetical protein
MIDTPLLAVLLPEFLHCWEALQISKLEMAAAAVRSSPIPPPLGVGNKRKRGNEDMGRNVKVTNPNDQDVYTTSMLQGLSTSADDESTRNAAQAALAGTMGEMYPETGYDSTAALTAAFGAGTPPNLDTSGQAAYGTPGQTPSKPAVGTPQWHQQRKENHKEGMKSSFASLNIANELSVERRRREVINEGIENIAKIVPGYACCCNFPHLRTLIELKD